MILANKQSIRLIGYPESTITQEAKFFMSQEFAGDIEIVSPEEFLASNNNNENYSYGVAFTLDEELRQRVIDVIEAANLDCIIYIHDSVTRFFSDEHAREFVGAGTFVSPQSTMLMGSKLGKHCIVETYCLISHYVEIGDNTQLHSGVMIAGKTTIGKNCMFNFKSTVLNALTIGDNIELGAMSCFTKNVEEPGKYVGTPARRIGDRIKFATA